MPDKIKYDAKVTHEYDASSTPIKRPDVTIYKRQGVEPQQRTIKADTAPINNITAIFNKIRYAPKDVFDKLKGLLDTPNIVADLAHFDDVIINIKNQENVYNPYFKMVSNKLYQDAMLNYGDTRLYRYSEYAKMDSYSPEVSRALDAIANDATKKGPDGNVLVIKSPYDDVVRDVEDLFFKTLKLNSKGWHEVRALAKYGDHFEFIIFDERRGVINLIPVEVFDIERQEGTDDKNPFSYNFKMIAGGNYAINYAHYLGSPFYSNQQETYENYQVSHTRLDGESKALPYGVSILEGARRIWRQLIVMEDSMIIHRLTRAPSRYKYTIITGNMPVEDIPAYIQKYKNNLTRSVIMDEYGNVDYRKSLLSMDENLFVPKRSNADSDDISIVDGLQWDAIEDIDYLHKKFLSGLGVPNAFLSFEENINAKNTLAQEDVRYAETVSRIQQAWVEEKQRLAIIHLFAKGYTPEEINSLEIFAIPPSEMLAQMKLNNLNSQAAVGGALIASGTHSPHYVQKEIHNMTEEEIEKEELYNVRADLGKYQRMLAQTQGLVYTIDELLEISKKKKEAQPLLSPMGQGMTPGMDGGPMGGIPMEGGLMDELGGLGEMPENGGPDMGMGPVPSPQTNGTAMAPMTSPNPNPSTMSGEKWIKESNKEKVIKDNKNAIYNKSLAMVINNFISERTTQ